MAIGFGPWAAAALGSLAKGYGEGQKQKDEINQAAMEAYLKQKLLEMQQQQADDARRQNRFESAYKLGSMAKSSQTYNPLTGGYETVPGASPEALTYAAEQAGLPPLPQGFTTSSGRVNRPPNPPAGRTTERERLASDVIQAALKAQEIGKELSPEMVSSVQAAGQILGTPVTSTPRKEGLLRRTARKIPYVKRLLSPQSQDIVIDLPRGRIPSFAPGSREPESIEQRAAAFLLANGEEPNPENIAYVIRAGGVK